MISNTIKILIPSTETPQHMSCILVVYIAWDLFAHKHSMINLLKQFTKLKSLKLTTEEEKR